MKVDDAPRALLAQAYAVLHCYWVGYAVPTQYGATAPSGVVAPGGRWIARCPSGRARALAVADIDLDRAEPDIDTAVRLARPWRRTARMELRSTRPCVRIPVVDPVPRSDLGQTVCA